MDLPAHLRAVADEALDGIDLATLAGAAEALSARYRGEVRDGRMHLSADLYARAYMAARLPATYAAIRAAVAAASERMPDLAPRTLLDIGAGPGSATWATLDCWPSIEAVTLAEGSPAIRAWGERMARAAAVPSLRWIAGDVRAGLVEAEPADIVTIGYVLDELEPAERDALIRRAFALTGDLLVVVEPGTPAGWQRILAARDLALGAGGVVVAPCPHQGPCPLVAPDWCHFSRRLARSRLHLRAKRAEVPFEDEKFAYLAVARRPGEALDGRVLTRPRAGSGHVELKLCRQEGDARVTTFSRRDGDIYKVARRLDWGDGLAP
ncbi:small ribosomal subunit Rsm22 family protein [Methylobrevis pamukkalensis]|uniref:Mitochondrial small ribosomal subunit Rsm22 n=1 Tax=Methylobrevis pamukkalensis TaxID=1439726 RepID=A0A1E3H1V8_9HYPH|nr:small ribosomal subunit Rsm22 family protein [Methylobrevis pamukkalensis]ODN69776.1 Mitochondrial small ribosomal subunit Rsm22 [Methylobrevis pamukkalensis]